MTTTVTLMAHVLSLLAIGQESQGRILVHIIDSSGKPLSCRAWVDVGNKRLFQPSGPEGCTPYARDRSFSCDGHFTMAVPAGAICIHIERGKGYRPVNRKLTIRAGQSLTFKIPLQRWVDMPAEGWYSSDMHVHFGAQDMRVLRQLALADDVHIVPAFTYWLRGTELRWPDSWPSFEGGEPLIVDATHMITRKAVEIERIHHNAVAGGSIGATFLFNLSQPVFTERYGEYFPTDTDLCLVAQQSSPEVVIDTDKPSWAETVVGAALGVYDTVQVCHNHYHREQTLQGGWGMIGPLEAGESNAAAEDGLFHRTNNLYYRLLNCGFCLGVSGGSAIGVMPVPMGYNRVYAKVKGSLTVAKFWAAVKAGCSFATSGPMLTMTADGQELGSVIDIQSKDNKPIKVRTHVRSIERLESLQLIHNGKVVESIDLANMDVPQPIDHTQTWQVRAIQSGWIAARTLFRAPDKRLRQAHTSPIYFIVDKQPIAQRDDALYMIRWIDRLVEIAKGADWFPLESDRQAVLNTYARARAVYEGIAERSP